MLTVVKKLCKPPAYASERVSCDCSCSFECSSSFQFCITFFFFYLVGALVHQLQLVLEEIVDMILDCFRVGLFHIIELRPEKTSTSSLERNKCMLRVLSLSELTYDARISG
jgi:hypothetical protein